MFTVEKSYKFWFGIALIVGISSISLLLVGFFQGPLGIKDWLIPISGFVSLITLAIGSWLAVNEYLLKVDIEKRLKNTAQIESNIQLLTLFSKMWYYYMVTRKWGNGIVRSPFFVAWRKA